MSNNAYYLIKQLAAESAKSVKQEMLTKIWTNSDNMVFRSACTLALDPFITYGVKKMPKVAPGNEEFNCDTFLLLERLQDRELTGNSAKAAIELELGRLSFESGELLKMVLTGKLGAGFTANSINLIAPGTIFLFKMHLAEKFNEHSHKITEYEWTEGVEGEIKEDGVRGVSMDIKDYHFLSRNGLPLNSDTELRAQVKAMLAKWKDYFSYWPELGYSEDDLMCLDCEMVEINDCFNDSVGSARTKDEGRARTLQIKVIDVLTQRELETESRRGYGHRRFMLKDFFNRFGDSFSRIHLIESFTFHSAEEVFAKFKELNDAGKEGLMIKAGNGVWVQKRTTGWLKVKGKIDVDLVVKRLEEGDESGKYRGLMGSAVCDYVNSKGNTVEVKIGGGWSLEQRAQYWASFTNTNVEFSKTTKGVVEEFLATPDEDLNPVGWLIECTAHEETKDGSLRHPNFRRHRTDKSADEGQGC